MVRLSFQLWFRVDIDGIEGVVDYNFDKMINSHGGYLIDENDEKAKRDKERIEKNKKERLDLLNKQGLMHEPGSFFLSFPSFPRVHDTITR